MRRLRWLVLSAALVGVSGVVRAQGAPPPRQALDVAATVEQHDAAAKGHYRAGRYDDALREFEAAYRLSLEPIFLFNSAQVLRAKGSYPEAVAKYELFLDAEQDPKNTERLQAISYLRDVRRLMEMQERERQAREQERLAREREALAREREALAREREREALARVADRRGRGFRAKLAASPSLRVLYGTPFLGADLGLMLGGQVPRLGVYFSLDYFVGATLFALQTMAVRPGLTLEGILGRWRVGGSVYFSVLMVRRASADEYMVDGGGGVSLHGSADVWRFGERALYLGLRVGVDGLAATNPSGARSAMVDVTALAGFRL